MFWTGDVSSRRHVTKEARVDRARSATAVNFSFPQPLLTNRRVPRFSPSLTSTARGLLAGRPGGCRAPYSRWHPGGTRRARLEHREHHERKHCYRERPYQPVAKSRSSSGLGVDGGDSNAQSSCTCRRGCRGRRSPTSLTEGVQERGHRLGDDLSEGESAASGVGADCPYEGTDNIRALIHAKGRRKNRFRFFAKWVRWCSSISA